MTYRLVPTVVLYRGDPDAASHRDHRWRIESARDIVADGSQGYSRRKDMQAGMWSALEGLLRWALHRDYARLLTLLGRLGIGTAPDGDTPEEDAAFRAGLDDAALSAGSEG